MAPDDALTVCEKYGAMYRKFGAALGFTLAEGYRVEGKLLKTLSTEEAYRITMSDKWGKPCGDDEGSDDE